MASSRQPRVIVVPRSESLSTATQPTFNRPSTSCCFLLHQFNWEFVLSWAQRHVKDNLFLTVELKTCPYHMHVAAWRAHGGAAGRCGLHRDAYRPLGLVKNTSSCSWRMVNHFLACFFKHWSCKACPKFFGKGGGTVVFSQTNYVNRRFPVFSGPNPPRHRAVHPPPRAGVVYLFFWFRKITSFLICRL